MNKKQIKTVSETNYQVFCFLFYWSLKTLIYKNYDCFPYSYFDHMLFIYYHYLSSVFCIFWYTFWTYYTLRIPKNPFLVCNTLLFFDPASQNTQNLKPSSRLFSHSDHKNTLRMRYENQNYCILVLALTKKIYFINTHTHSHIDRSRFPLLVWI